MSASISTLPAALAVEPGGDASCRVQIRNTGEVVDQLTFELLGDAASWADVVPASVSLFPGGEAGVEITFKPPRTASTPAGPMPFALKVLSRENSEATAVEEGGLLVGSFADAGAEILPRTGRGRLSASYQLAFDNRGNEMATGPVIATDPDDALEFRVKPNELTADPGAASFGKIRVRPRKRIWRGMPRTHPFQLVIEPSGSERVTLDATLHQEPLIPRWAPAAVVALLGLTILWAVLLRPTIESAARNAVEKPLGEQLAKVIGAEKNAAEAANSAAAASASAATASNSATATKKAVEQKLGEPVPAPELAEPVRTPVSRRLQAQCPSVCSPSFKVPAGQTLSVTDLVLESPKGDSGTLTIRRDDAPALVAQLENFRTLDYHFIAPLVVDAGHELVLEIECANETGSGDSVTTGAQSDEAAKPCSAALFFAGFSAKAEAK